MIFDIVVLFVLLVSAVIAFIRGIIRESLTILGVVGGMFMAYFFAPFLQPFVRGWLGVKDVVDGADSVQSEKIFGIFPPDVLADGLSYSAIFILVVILLSIVSHILAESAKSLGLGAIDRTLGVVFGLARGVLILAVLYAPFHYFMDKATKEAWFGSSASHVYIEMTTAALSNFVPDETLQKLENDAEKISQTIGDPRAKLEEMKVLKEQYDVLKGELPPEGVEEEGYSDEFRRKMDEKFNQGGTDSPEGFNQ